MNRHNLYRRTPHLVYAILDYIDAAGDDEHRPEATPWGDILDDFVSDDLTQKTIENVLYDLTTFGVIRRAGQPAARGRADTRTVSMTRLGVAWFHQQPMPAPLGGPASNADDDE